MKLAIASDHAGFKLKEEIKTFLKNYNVTDFGPDSEDSMDYPDTGIAAAESVAKGEVETGILICGSGIGMSIAANKVKGIRAALCQTAEFARLARLHNNANVLVLSGRFIASHLAFDIIKTWLSTKFEGGRHQNRLDKIKKYEEGGE